MKFIALFLPLFLFAHDINPIVKEKKLLQVETLKRLKSTFELESLVEIGSGTGLSAKRASAIFDQVHTLERSAKKHKIIKAKLRTIENTRCYQGERVESMIKESSPNRLFLLNVSPNDPSKPSIFQDLELIAKLGSNRDVILIDRLPGIFHLKQPETFKMSPLKEHLSTLFPNHKLCVLGKVLLCFDQEIYPEVSISPAVECMTTIRLDETAIDLDRVLEAEKELMTLADPVLTQIDSEYPYWAALTHLGLQNFKKAGYFFSRVINSTKEKHWRLYGYRIKCYLAYCQYKPALAYFNKYCKNAYEKNPKSFFNVLSEKELQKIEAIPVPGPVPRKYPYYTNKKPYKENPMDYL